MSGRDIVVIGTSAGGLQALMTIVGGLPAKLSAALFVVMHTSADNGGALPRILAKACQLPVAHAQAGETIHHGRVYVAPPDYHLLIDQRHVHVSRGPRENHFRPAVDPLFRSAARSHGPRVLGIVLSGGMNDGTQGLLLVKHHGGVAMVQSPEDAMVPGMPRSAIRHVDVDYILSAAEMPPVIESLSHGPVQPVRAFISPAEQDAPVLVKADLSSHPPDAAMGAPSGFTCPECGGALWEREDGRLLGYRCHVGHGFTAESLASEQSERLEAALWTALRGLQETVTLKHKMARCAEAGGLDAMAAAYEKQAREAEAHASTIQQVLLYDGNMGEPSPLQTAAQGAPRRFPATQKSAARKPAAPKPGARKPAAPKSAGRKPATQRPKKKVGR